MSKPTLVWIGAAVVVIVAGTVVYYSLTGSSVPGNAGGPSAATQASSSGSGASSSFPSSTTAKQLPSGGAGIAVPSLNATNVPAGVAAPTVVASGSPSGLTSFRSFNITETASAFTPDTIIVNEGDTVHINITAKGGSYDFTQPDMGLSLSLSSGQTKLVQFDANTVGKFQFYCKSCGGPTNGPTGYIEVVSK